mmetsp:Transcript_3086/g.6294  ORF Transcript_3086/g.6294 Transcript_3086/m.6294 type:complete len:298 (-) Transcript_3086:130-1023(-)
MTTIHETDEMNSICQILDQDLVEIVISDHTIFLKVAWDERLVVSIGFVAVIVAEFGSVSGIVQKDGITLFRMRHHRPIRLYDILPRRLRILPIIHENDDIVLLKSVHVHNILLHIQHIVPTPAQLPRLIPHVINPDHDRPPHPRGGLGNQIELGLHVNGIHRGQLRYLGVSPLFQMASHLLENLGEAQILFGNAFVGVEDFEEGGGAGAAGPAGGVGELEGGDVGDVGGGLAVGAAGDHADVFAEFVGFVRLKFISGHASVVGVVDSHGLEQVFLDGLRSGIFEFVEESHGLLVYGI